MTFAEKLKALRKQEGMSQEMLAEALGVSRQAVTKWESNTGIPDIENIKAVSLLFHISIDALLFEEKQASDTSSYLYESVTEYDIAEEKKYDMKLGGVHALQIYGYDGEKLLVRLASNTLATLQSDCKVTIDDIKKRIDVDVSRTHDMSEALTKKEVMMYVQIPVKYVDQLEFEVNAQTIHMEHLECTNIEFSGKAQQLMLNDITASVEINCNLDMNITCRNLHGDVSVNQISATSKIHVPRDMIFTAKKKGIATKITYERDGTSTAAFDHPDADYVIELNGMKSELAICTSSQQDK